MQKAARQERINEWMSRIHDRDGDGKLNEEETAAMDKAKTRLAEQRRRWEQQRKEMLAKHDADEDGRAELQRIYAKGVRVREEEDQNGDGTPEIVTAFEGDTLLRREADTNDDGRMDTFITFRDGEKASQEEDRNGDGEIDARYTFGPGEKIGLERLDDDYDGTFEITNEHEDGVLARRTIAAGDAETHARREFFEKGALVRVDMSE